jgi:O-antigen/teichoic acid export membrane protein
VALAVGLYFANRNGLLPSASVYASPELPLVIAVSAFAAVISGFASTKLAIAHRSFNQQRVVQIEVVSQIVASAVMMTIATFNHSVWALVTGGLVASVSSAVLSHTWLQGHSNRLRLERAALRELSDFGKWVFISSAVSVFAMNGDRLLLGGLVDANVLGTYAIAVMMVGAIEGLLQRLFGTISLPALSEVARNDPSRLREIYYRLRIPGDLLLLFAAGALFQSGHLVIDLLYDPRYAQAGHSLEVLALSLIVVRYGVAHQVYLALAVPRYLSLINIVRFASLFTLVPALYHFAGFDAAVWGIALHGFATVPFVYYFNAKLGLNDWRRELLVLAALPAGLLCGTALNALLR